MTSGARLVKPHAIDWLWPMTMPGVPAKVYPVTSSGQSSLSSRQCRPIWYQMPGMLTPRCGSLASRGLPVVERSPLTTHELDPMPAPRPSMAGTASMAVAVSVMARRAAAVRAVDSSSESEGGACPARPDRHSVPERIGECRVVG